MHKLTPLRVLVHEGTGLRKRRSGLRELGCRTRLANLPVPHAIFRKLRNRSLLNDCSTVQPPPNDFPPQEIIFQTPPPENQTPTIHIIMVQRNRKEKKREEFDEEMGDVNEPHPTPPPPASRST